MKETMHPETEALLIVDVQTGFDDPVWGVRNNPVAENNIARLLAHWRELGLPVLHVQHCSVEEGSPLRPDGPGCNFKRESTPLPGEPIFKKEVNSAFIGTDLESYLRQRDINRLLIVGLTTDHCVSTTVRMAANLGFTVRVAADSTATFDRTGPDNCRYDAETIHSISLASLHNEFAQVISTDEALR